MKASEYSIIPTELLKTIIEGLDSIFVNSDTSIKLKESTKPLEPIIKDAWCSGESGGYRDKSTEEWEKELTAYLNKDL